MVAPPAKNIDEMRRYFWHLPAMQQTPTDPFRAGEDERLEPSFRWLNWTQFQGALNDNIFKLLVTFFLIRSIGADQASRLSGLGGIIFALPFILFVPAAGVLADRYSKTRITVAAKFGEIAVMAAAVLVFWLCPPSMGFVVLFLMSTQSALFGPTKYGIIPELVRPDQLSRANGYLVSFTYLSIILGTVCAPLLVVQVVGPSITDNRGELFALAGLACVAIAVTGTLTSLRIRRTPAAGSTASISWMFWRDVTRTLQRNRGDRYLILAILASAYFSLVGAFIQLNLIPFAMVHLGLSETDGGLLFLYAAFGIGGGSLLAGRLSGRNIEFGMIPFGALLIALSSALLFFLPYSVMATRVLMFTAGVGAGLFIIPIEAFIQYRAPRDQMGSVMAANGFLSWMGVLGAGFLVFGFSFIPFWQPAYTFALLGLLTLFMTIYCLVVLPDFFVRFVAMLLTRSVYRIRRVGLHHLPLEGGALLVANHVTTMDALIILASQQRRIRFLMERSIYASHPLRLVFRLMGVIPISETDAPRQLVAALQQARAELDRGYLVCIFAEGALTRNGQMRAFKPGLERIVRGSSYPIIPVYLGGLWGSRFSHYRSLFRGEKAALRWRYPVTVAVGEPMPTGTPAWRVQRAVSALSSIHVDLRISRRRHIGQALIRSARRHRRRQAIDDTTGKTLTYGRMLIGALALARYLRRLLPAERHVGVVLPTSVGGTLVNLALTLAGKVPVNLNFTVSRESFASALAQADIKVIITTRKLVQKVTHIEWPSTLIHAEDIAGALSRRDKLVAALQAWLWPASWLTGPAAQGGHEPLTIMFSSGTTGEPKGVVLSHHNVLSNCESITEIFRADADAHLCATLPIFHSFGFTAGIYFPLLCGARVSYHTSPLDSGQVIDVIKSKACNVLFTTPSFLSSYLRRAEPGDFRSLKFVLVGAEKLGAQLADACERVQGIRPLEGYGTTEMSPVVSLNLPPVGDGALRQVGNKPGSIGQTLPGVAATVVDLDTGAELPPGESGMLLVKGPNRMTGYLGRPDLTAAAFRGEWYVTGDIARMDEEGFIFITDRIHRFSKIGGEMVPHVAIEETLIRGLDLVEIAIAVTAVPDEKKGERLVLLYTESAGSPERLQDVLRQSNLPNLWRPSEQYFIKVEQVPLTATGKVDVRTIRQLARERVSRDVAGPA